MFEVYWSDGELGDITNDDDYHRRHDPLEAEVDYLELCLRKNRIGATGTVTVNPGTYDQLVARAVCKIVEGEIEEMAPERRHIWAKWATEYDRPVSAYVLRAAARLAKWSGAEAARRLGITGRQWRYLAADPGKPVDFRTWFTLREMVKEKFLEAARLVQRG